MEYHLFVSSGGMGSTHLVHSIREAGVPCIEKPIVNTLFTERWPRATRALHDRPSARSLDERITPAICHSFATVQERFADFPDRFSFDAARSIADNFLEYFAFLRSIGAACVLRATSLEGILVRRGVRKTVFLIRDPLQAYASYAKPERHRNDIDALGGVESDAAIAFWSWSWNAVAHEYLVAAARGLEPVLIRYEEAAEDAARVGSELLTRVFGTFVPRENEIALSLACRRKIMERVAEAHSLICGRPA